MQTKILSSLTVLMFPLLAGAWGAVGHRTIGLLAQERLTPQARAWVQGLLGAEDLPAVANWADSLRSTDQYRATVWYHFEKISDGVPFLDHVRGLPDWQKAKGGVITAILAAEDTLRDSSKSHNERADALKFLVHFVGDLHQPLHSGRPEDNGGVKIKVTWFGTQTSLHHIWDASMIETGHADILKDTHGLDETSMTYGAWLDRHFASDSFTNETDLGAWLNESLLLRTGAYDPAYKNNQKKYLADHLGEVDQRVYVAGLRLARLVNDLAAGQAENSPDAVFRREIEKILGSVDQLINLRP